MYSQAFPMVCDRYHRTEVASELGECVLKVKSGEVVSDRDRTQSAIEIGVRSTHLW
ncbi:MAG: hypothetical protein J7642_00390 [Cyanobacteria bacterium SBC]|nr:hypothetical protein [Cyanobacteria bacterium SBC]